MLDCWEAMKSDCKKATELIFENVKRSADFLCAKKNLDGNVLAVISTKQSIYVHLYGGTVIPVDDYVPMRRVPIGRGQFSACQ